MSDGGKSPKVAGVVVAVVLVLLSLFLLFLSNIKITKKDKSSPSTVVSVETSKVEVTPTIVATVTPAPVVEESTSVSGETDSSVSSGSDGLIKITNEGLLDYTSADLTTTGVVDSKECYLSGNQVVYLLNINVGVGSSAVTMRYYCTYTGYSQVNVGDMVTVVYKQVSASAFAIMGVTKE